MALMSSFLENPEKALRKCARGFPENGKLVLGAVPADSPWGRAYIRKGNEDPVYAHAWFRTVKGTRLSLKRWGLSFGEVAARFLGIPAPR
ncbi:hypothetical protein [Desulfosarcina sp.]|uniref:hypothetical protein n=1 Tax=Desulfosarcina sp. TaxID=2027861 RepID=UPI0039706983